MSKIDMSTKDKLFGRLTAIRPDRTKGGVAGWFCECECGNTVVVATNDLKSGHSKSCGCLCNEVRLKNITTHGMNRTREHIAWKAMKARVKTGLKYIAMGRYVCPELKQNFVLFYELLGDRPSPNHSVDRIENTGSYTCGQCQDCLAQNQPMNIRWATKKVQNRNQEKNRLLTFNDETRCMAEWAEIYGMQQNTLRMRLEMGWPLEDALTKPVMKMKGRNC